MSSLLPIAVPSKNSPFYLCREFTIKKTFHIAFSLLALGFLSGCATVFTGTKQTVQVNSIPSGAKVEVDGVERGRTPTPIVLKKGYSGQVLTLSLRGYEQKTFQPETTFNPISILNLGSVFGWGVDAISGAMWKYDPAFYNIHLNHRGY